MHIEKKIRKSFSFLKFDTGLLILFYFSKYKCSVSAMFFYRFVGVIKGQVLYFRNPSWVVSQNTILGTHLSSFYKENKKNF